MSEIDEIPEVIYTEDNKGNYSFTCPHCGCDMTDVFEYEPIEEDDTNPFYVNSDRYVIRKDPYFCEASCIMRQTFRCPNCGNCVSDYVEWDK